MVGTQGYNRFSLLSYCCVEYAAFPQGHLVVIKTTGTDQIFAYWRLAEKRI